jgi:outer membrane protein assembly factor BamB
VNADGSLLAVRAGDGTLLWQTEARNYATGPIISGGMAFTADLDGRTVWAFAEPDLIDKLPPAAIADQPTLQPAAGLPDPFRVIGSTPLAETGVTLSPYERGRSEGPEGLNMTVGTDGLLYVIDPASVVTVIDPATMKVVRRFGRQGSGDAEFHCICTIDASPDGLLYVVDPGNHRIQVLEPGGTFVRQLGAFGSADGQIVQPFRLAVDAVGAAYAIDGDNGMISKFGADGAFAWRVGGLSGDANLRGAYDLVAMKDGTILVTLDPGGPAVLLDPADGSVIGRWGTASLGPSAEPTVDAAGNVFSFQYVDWAMRMFDAKGHDLGILDWADDVADAYEFYPTPVFAPDGYGYSFDDTQGLLRLEITVP